MAGFLRLSSNLIPKGIPELCGGNLRQLSVAATFQNPASNQTRNLADLGSKNSLRYRSQSCGRIGGRKLPNNYFLVPVASIKTSAALGGEVVEVAGPAFAESISEGDIRWLKAVGDAVTQDEVIAEIETDKTTVEVPATHSGVIRELLVPDGEKVVAKQNLYKLEIGAEGAAPAAAPAPPKAEEAAKPAAPQTSAPSPATPIPSSPPPVSKPPSAPISSITPSVTKRPPVPVPSGVKGEIAITGARTETRVKINRMRNRIAERLKDAQNTYAMLTTFNEIDMSNIVEMRKQFGPAFLKKHGVKLGFMSPFVKACAYALQDQPVVNAVIDDQEILYRHFVDLSVAVATPKGLVVPVLRNVEALNLAGIEKEMISLGERARDGKLAIEDMEGGTFTISNGGVFGSMFGTPIINPPQSAILGMHAIIERPMAVNGKVEIRPIMTVALTYDHRLIDGREAVTFLKKIKSAVEDPRIMLLDL